VSISTVAIVKVKNSVMEATAEAMELAKWKDWIPSGADISLKPNLGWDLFLPGSVTSPWVVEGVIQTIKSRVGKVHIVEAGQILVNVEKAVRQTRIYDLCKKYDVEWVNISKNKYKKVRLDNGRVFKKIWVPEILTKTVLITIPVIKTHGKTTITGSIKNQWGCLPEFRHNYHPVLNEVLVDINLAVKPRFSVVDGTVCLEGNGPKSGKPKVLDLILASGDIVAADAVQARIMGFDPAEIQSITNCAGAGCGQYEKNKILVVGEKIEDVKSRFQPAKHNPVSLTEQFLRKNRWLREIVFNTLILKICCWGAKAWYLLWYYFGPGKSYRDEIIHLTKYGRQWK
jgi:uncharacterized protein (DUF362 family)